MRTILLIVGIPVAMLVNLQVYATTVRVFITIDIMNDQLQRSGLSQVTSVRGIPHFCREAGFIDGLFYAGAVDVARIPDAFWASAAARRYWQRVPFDENQQFELRQWADSDASADKHCPALPLANSSRYVVTFLYSEDGDLGPPTARSRGKGIMIYDTKSSRLYWAYSGW
ncbi:hypothetical protein [Xanthomonas codiaei]|uniref:hypothetical protein n=1 Tax=Xanthomonas codiaei TaxID=56463 RepID=UPI001ABFF4F9|nr:hypothetical protein [Xanthomonas codiaei]